MRVRVVYFASARELASTRGETLSLSDGASVEDLARKIMELHPELRPLERSAKFSVNLEVTGSETRLKEGDEVGVLPPVAGG